MPGAMGKVKYEIYNPVMCERPSRLATFLARVFLRGGRYPGRRWVGAPFRREAQRRGGIPFSVTTDDGLRLDAWVSPAAGGSAPALTVVIMHGWLEFKELYLSRAYRLNAQGHDVVLFDQRAHGRSEGAASTFGVREKHDAKAVIDSAIAIGAASGKVITLGHSMGAATALQHAALDPRVAGVVAFAPYSTLRQAIESFRQAWATLRQAIESFRQAWAPWADRQWVQRGFDRATREAGFDVAAANTLAAMRRLAIPVLMIEGARDANLPPAEHSRRLAAAHPNGRLQILTVEEASHYTLPRHAWPGIDEAIARFCRGVGDLTQIIHHE
jgi:pimeloyl-ACP methyl ester carboxylesterase